MFTWVLGATEIRAQLAITEVMTWASTNCCPEAGERGCNPDFWELTNFGTEEIHLANYFYIERENTFPSQDAIPPWKIPAGVSILPNESIIFFRAGWIPDAAAFREWWWGDPNYPDAPQIICCYPEQGFGLDYLGDAVRLFDPNSNVVDQVYFGETKRGFTFAYDTETGAAMQSELGVCGAFQAALCGDVGSPGTNCGPVPLRIIQEPVSQTNDAGSDVTLSIRAVGLPRPRYQWYFNGAPLTASNAGTSSIPRLANFAGCGPAWIESPIPPDLIIPNVQASHAGEYFAVVSNGLEKLTSAVVRLSINSAYSPVRLECPPATACALFEGDSVIPALVVVSTQTTTFKVIARGYPPPTFQWSWSADGTAFVDIPGAIDSTFEIPNVQPSTAGVYRVQVQNTGSVAYAVAELIVQPTMPRLKITEAMSYPCHPDANDWWELTNVGDEPVNLCGYRWDDDAGAIGAGPTITNAVIVHPGESVIILEGQTAEFFMQWWGASNLPAGQQFIRYTANGLEPGGDNIHVWNPTASNADDWVDAVSFSIAPRGTSFWFAPNDLCSEFGMASVAGDCGAFRAVQSCDVGSPGWTPWTPPRLTSIRRDGGNVVLEWKAQPGSMNVVQYTSSLASPPATNVWMNLKTPLSFTGASGVVTDDTLAGAPQRFYRVKRDTAANCPCF